MPFDFRYQELKQKMENVYLIKRRLKFWVINTKISRSGLIGSNFCLAHIEEYSISGGDIVENFSLNLFTNKL